ncbi:MAG: peptidoglycan DD-metalloendopeptidase family protein [Burkholderiales bacterium]
MTRHAARPVCLLVIGLVLSACSTRQSAPVVERAPSTPATPAAKPAPAGAPVTAATATGDFYTVKRGDTLFGIALDQGQDYREIAAWNSLANPNLIREGQVLRVKPPGVAAKPAVMDEGGVIVRPIVAPGGAPAAASGPRTEPSGAKRPYSDETLAQMQRDAAGPAVARTKPEAPRAAETATRPEPAARPAEPPLRPGESDEVAWSWPLNGRVIETFTESGTNKGIDIAAKVGDPVLAAGPGRVVYSGSGLRGYGRLVIIKHNNTYLSAYAHNSTILVKEGQTVTRGQKIAEAGNTDADVPKLHFEIRRQGRPIDPLKLLPEAR